MAFGFRCRFNNGTAALTADVVADAVDVDGHFVVTLAAFHRSLVGVLAVGAGFGVVVVGALGDDGTAEALPVSFVDLVVLDPVIARSF